MRKDFVQVVNSSFLTELESIFKPYQENRSKEHDHRCTSGRCQMQRFQFWFVAELTTTEWRMKTMMMRIWTKTSMRKTMKRTSKQDVSVEHCRTSGWINWNKNDLRSLQHEMSLESNERKSALQTLSSSSPSSTCKSAAIWMLCQAAASNAASWLDSCDVEDEDVWLPLESLEPW